MREPRSFLTGLILAGGRAERMGGRDKGLLPLANEPLIAHGIRQLKPQVAEVVISANRNLEIYRAQGCWVISDDPERRFGGPLAGILAVLPVVETPWLLTAPCDSPLLPPNYAVRMWAALTQAQATAAVAVSEGRWQPVFALLSVDLHADLAAWLATGERGVGRWLQRQRPVPVDFTDRSALFHNVNTPEDLVRLEAEWDWGDKR